MTKFGHIGRGLVLATAALIGSATSASADPMLFTLEGETFNDLSASVLFSYTGLTDGSGRIDISVTNTSSAFDPRLTGFAFNLPGAPTVTGISGFTSSLSGWESSYDPNDINTPGQFGFYDAAALTGPDFNGGSPNAGIARGVTGNFSFTLAGSGMLGLTESSFLSLLAFDPLGAPNESEQYFIGRFQQVGLLGESSDVAIPTGPPTTPPSDVPEPTTLLLSGLGVLGLTAVRRKA
jgi:PEP-CTERM motif